MCFPHTINIAVDLDSLLMLPAHRTQLHACEGLLWQSNPLGSVTMPLRRGLRLGIKVVCLYTRTNLSRSSRGSCCETFKQDGTAPIRWYGHWDAFGKLYILFHDLYDYIICFRPLTPSLHDQEVISSTSHWPRGSGMFSRSSLTFSV